MKYILAHDLGTSSNKAVVITLDGEVITASAASYDVLTPEPGWAEQDPAAWWDAVCRSSRHALADAGISPAEIAAVSFTGQMQGVLPVDRKGTPLSHCLIWLDMRAKEQSREATRGWVRIHGYGVKRLARWLWTTNGAPTLSGKDPLAKMLWLRDKRPALWAQTHKLLDAKDYLLHRTTGNFVTTYDCGNSTWLMDTRNGRREWSQSLLRTLGIPEEKLPALIPGTAIAGELQSDAARDMGLRAGTPVVAGAGDVAAMAVGTGTVRDHDVNLAIGTSAWLATHVPGRLRDLRTYVASICSAHPDKQLLVAHQETGGACLEWARTSLSGWEHPAGAQGPTYKDLDALVEGYGPGASDLLFLPWMNGEYAPVDDPWARGGFVNLSLNHEVGHLVRAVYEGVALNARWALGAIENLTGRPSDALRFSGGGASSEVWCQIVADVLDRPIIQFDRPRLAAARGAALIASVALGEIANFEDIARIVPGRARYEPARESQQLYADKFGLFKEFYRRNRAFFRHANNPRPKPGAASAAPPA